MLWRPVLDMKMLVVCVLTAVVGGCAMEISDEEYGKFPRLYHLDDYSSCLSKADGLYCVGTFTIQPPKQYDHTYELIQEYSSDPFHFNRTQVHRGYCVSERCPSAERNSSLRFERCGAQWGRRRRLRLALTALDYCKSHAQEYARQQNPEPYDLSQKVLLAVVAALCFVNFVGTVYDVFSEDEEKKNQVLVMWSVRSNWRRLTASYEDGDPQLNALSPVQGVRVFLMFLVIGTHGGAIHDMLYLQNPQFVEKVSRNPLLMLFMNGTSVVMIFVLISSFLLAYNLLLLSRTRVLSLRLLPYCLLKRFIRITPVYLLVVGFAATFWARMRTGPMWPLLVEPESRVCREKFWLQALYVNNLARPDDHCLIQTWFLATDMQLYVVSCVLTLYMSARGAAALAPLAALALASCLLNGLLAYVFHWESLLYHVYPETMHTMYHGVASFYRLYISPWGSLPACLLGLLLAHLHHELQLRGVKPQDYRFFRWLYTASPLLMVSWIIAGNWVREVTDPVFTASYVALERPVISILAATILLGLFNGIPGAIQNWCSWSGWHAMGRMSLSVMMIHWIVNTCIAAARPQPQATSLLDVMVDSVATGTLSYIAAVPLTVMVEMPLLRTGNTFIFRQEQKKHIKQS